MPSHHIHRHLHQSRDGLSHMGRSAAHLSHAHGLESRTPASPSEGLVREQLENVKETFQQLEIRGSTSSDNTINIVLGVLAIVFFSLVLVALFFLYRRIRSQRSTTQAGDLPHYEEKLRNPQDLTIETTHNGHSSVVVIGQDGRPMLKNCNSPPNSPDNVPEIRITFPDEQDAEGQSQKGRVLIVRVGDNASVGLEPVQEDQLPAYEKDSKGQFQSIDMDQIGGLKDEKDRQIFQ